MPTLSDIEAEMVSTVHDFVERDVRPFVREIEHANEYPEAMIEQMKELGIFGLAIPERVGGTGCRCRATSTSPRSSPAAG